MIPAPSSWAGRPMGQTGGQTLRLAMDVTVRTPQKTHEYAAVFSHTFDAYDDALERFPDALRIEVKVLGPKP